MKHFLESLNETGKFVYPESERELCQYMDYVQDMGQEMTTALHRQFVESDVHSSELRLSALGKIVAFELLGKKLGLVPLGSENTVTEGLRLIFCVGDFFETWVKLYLRRIGYKILAQQTHVKWHGVGGHIDFLVEGDDGLEHLLEIKSANEWYFKSVDQLGYPTDERGYLTQLATYSESLGIPPERSHWIFWNKNTADVRVYNLSDVPKDLLQHRLSRALAVSQAYFACNTPRDLYSSVQPPPASLEKTRDGKLVLDEFNKPKMYAHSSVKHPEFCYKTVQGKTKWGRPRTYVVDYNYPEEFSEFKPNILETALEYNR